MLLGSGSAEDKRLEDVDLNVGQLGLELLDQHVIDLAVSAVGHAVGFRAVVVPDVVDADEQENLGGMARGNAFEAVLDALDDVTADTAVAHFGVVEKLAPFGVMGDAVAEHDDVGGVDTELVEQRGALSPQGIVAVGLLPCQQRVGGNLCRGGHACGDNGECRQRQFEKSFHCFMLLVTCYREEEHRNTRFISEIPNVGTSLRDVSPAVMQAQHAKAKGMSLHLNDFDTPPHLLTFAIGIHSLLHRMLFAISGTCCYETSNLHGIIENDKSAFNLHQFRFGKI